MKKIIKLTGLFLASLFLGTSCDVDDKFLSPDSITEGSVPGYYASMINNERMRFEYYHVRTFLAIQTAIYSQTMVLNNGSSIYRQNDGYIGQFWRDFYVGKTGGDETASAGAMAMYIMMELQNEKATTPKQKTDNEYFLKAGEVVLYDRASQMIDLFGDVPFHTAGSILKGQSATVHAEFEDAATLYKEFIQRLDEISGFFKTAPANDAFKFGDILLQGRINLWQRYANSLRLKLLIHLSEVDPGYAQTNIMNMLSKPSEYPLIDADNNPNYDPSQSDVLLTPLTSYTKSLENALKEGNARVAPDYMLNDVMVPSKDPRLDLFFNKNGQATFKAPSIDMSGDEITSIADKVSSWDSTTFWFNSKLPGIRMTAAEVNFIKAEAFERWGTSAQAKTAYEIGVKQSVKFYYYLNSISSESQKEAMPTETEIADYLTNGMPYTSDKAKNLELIATQKWLHLGWLQSIEAWTEYRRTKLPKLLPFPSKAKDPGFETPPTRLLYPSKETSVNTNYPSVKAKDTRLTKIFWDVK